MADHVADLGVGLGIPTLEQLGQPGPTRGSEPVDGVVALLGQRELALAGALFDIFTIPVLTSASMPSSMRSGSTLSREATLSSVQSGRSAKR